MELHKYIFLRIKRYSFFLTIFFLLVSAPLQPVRAVTKMVVFPLVNSGGDAKNDWVRVVVAEGFARRAEYCAELQVINPTLLYAVDSTGNTMASDSLLKIHWQRWGWNVACGGLFTVSQNRVYCEMRVLFLQNGKPQRKSLHESASFDSLDNMCTSLFLQSLAVINYQLTKQDERAVRAPLSFVSASYATYCAGYGFEMNKNISAAITSYARSAELEPSFVLPVCRMAQLLKVTGSLDKARDAYNNCIAINATIPSVTAAAADFYLTHDPTPKALLFTQKNTQVLEQTAEGMTVLAKALLLRGEIQRGIGMLIRAIARGPVDLETDFMLGKTYLTCGEFVKATEVFNRLVKYQPHSARFYAFLGAAYRSSGKIMESLRILERINIEAPNTCVVQVNLAQTYFVLGWYEKAEQLLLAAHEKNPDMPDLFVNLGVVSWYRGNNALATSYFEKANKSSTNMQSALNNEANILYISGDKDNAIRLYKKADKVGGRNESILSNLGLAYVAKNRFNDAAACYEAVLSLSPNNLDVLEKCSSLAEKRNKPMDAVVYYRKILEINPHHEEALVNMTRILSAQGMFKEGLDPVETYLADFPNNKNILQIQAELYRRMGWYEVSAMKYQTMIKDFPQNAVGYVGLAKCMYDMIVYKNNTDYDKAIYYLKTASSLDKNDWEPDYLMGMIYLTYKNYRELALESFKASLQKTKDPLMQKTLQDCIAKAAK